jgi:hypothetical protein
MATTYTETPKDDTITHVEHSTPTVGQDIAKVSFSYEEEHALLKRVDYRVLPLLL